MRNQSAARVLKKSLIIYAIGICTIRASRVQACPMCRDSVSTDEGKTQTAESASLNFNTSIYAMLGGLAGIAGFTGRVIFKAVQS